jgi:endonuclease/exonuclease/phosphatase family metal-dependent hydrolase
MQFNILADGLSGMDREKGGFTASPPESLDWTYRRDRIVEETQRHKCNGRPPDVIAMQEVDHYHDFFKATMDTLGYDSMFIPKPCSPCTKSMDPNLEDGCALFWSRSRLAMLESETINYDKLSPDGVQTGQKSNQVALLATLRANGAAPVVFAVTHLAASKTPEGERIRAQQITQLLDRLLAKHLPCVIAADLNATPRPGAYPCEAYPAALAHPLRARSAYAAAAADGEEPAYTTWKRRGEAEARHTIDYILAAGPVGVARVLLPPADADVAPERLPGWRYPSDHIALCAELRLPPEQPDPH